MKGMQDRMDVIPINKETLRAKVYAHLREMIIAGELLPGEAITLRGLSVKFGVSVAPVREALVQLESEKVILRRDNRDYRVNTLNKSQFDQIIRIRRMLEPYLGEQACRKRPPSAIKEAKEILEAMRDAETDPKKYTALNRDLHFFFFSFADCQILLEIVRGLWARIGPYLTLNCQNQDIRQSLEIHSSMLAAFSHKNTKGFNRALLVDLGLMHRHVAPFISIQEESPD